MYIYKLPEGQTEKDMEMNSPYKEEVIEEEYSRLTNIIRSIQN